MHKVSGESWGRQTVDAAGSVLSAGRATIGPFREKFRGLALGRMKEPWF